MSKTVRENQASVTDTISMLVEQASELERDQALFRRMRNKAWSQHGELYDAKDCDAYYIAGFKYNLMKVDDGYVSSDIAEVLYDANGVERIEAPSKCSSATLKEKDAIRYANMRVLGIIANKLNARETTFSDESKRSVPVAKFNAVQSELEAARAEIARLKGKK